YSNRGWAYFNEKYYESAIVDFNAAIELDPGLAIAYCNRGWVHYAKRKKELAIADFEKTIELSDDPVLIHAAEEGIKALESNQAPQ
ncbi:MAG: tetratricopeptide repeat protein, partial [Dehalococcoidia bacterium]|nr:tetratricopeptide repeat protein [Dehalococcoidia bacterium]